MFERTSRGTDTIGPYPHIDPMQFFSVALRPKVQAEYPHLSFGDRAKKLSEMWKKLSPEGVWSDVMFDLQSALVCLLSCHKVPVGVATAIVWVGRVNIKHISMYEPLSLTRMSV